VACNGREGVKGRSADLGASAAYARITARSGDDKAGMRWQPSSARKLNRWSITGRNQPEGRIHVCESRIWTRSCARHRSGRGGRNEDAHCLEPARTGRVQPNRRLRTLVLMALRPQQRSGWPRSLRIEPGPDHQQAVNIRIITDTVFPRRKAMIIPQSIATTFTQHLSI
jgi:hypothetical protein